MVHRRIRRAGKYAVGGFQCNCRFFDDTQCPVCHCWFSACARDQRYCERCQTRYGRAALCVAEDSVEPGNRIDVPERDSESGGLRDQQSVPLENVQQAIGQLRSIDQIDQEGTGTNKNRSISTTPEAPEERQEVGQYAEVTRTLADRGLGMLKLTDRQLSLFSRAMFVPKVLGPDRPVPAIRSVRGDSTKSEVTLDDELAAYLRLQRIGVLMDDSMFPAIKRKSEAFFRKHDIPFVEQERMLSRVLKSVFDKNPVEAAIDGWTKGKKEYHVVRNNHAFAGLRDRKSPWLYRMWWWLCDTSVCAGGLLAENRACKWHAAHPVRVFPKAK